MSKPDEDVHWMEYAATYTIDIAPNPLTNWWMSYLNFQIEHHLFPSHLAELCVVFFTFCVFVVSFTG